MMDKAVVAQKAPFKVDVEAGKAYFWCACGRSQNQPFCDGSHKGTGLSPRQFKAEETKAIWLCGCKQTHTQPLCDGSHKALL
jgi:CDGSH-type Zn-finger protein